VQTGSLGGSPSALTSDYLKTVTAPSDYEGLDYAIVSYGLGELLKRALLKDVSWLALSRVDPIDV
jgi:hypothetical protein